MKCQNCNKKEATAYYKCKRLCSRCYNREKNNIKLDWKLIPFIPYLDREGGMK